MSGFEQADTDTLLTTRSNLLSGLDAVAVSLRDGTFEVVGERGAAPASQSGQTTLALLAAVDAELAARDRSRVADTALP